MFSTRSYNSPKDSLNENVKKVLQCRQLEYRKHLYPEKIQQKYKACLMSIPAQIYSNVSKISIGSPVGATFGTMSIYHFNPSNISMQAYSCCLIAFGMAYSVPEKDWNTLIINQILEDGKKLIEASIVKEENNPKKLNEITVNRKFVVNNNVMEIEILDPEYTGKVQSKDLTVPILLTSMKKFFQYSSYGLLLFGNETYYFIWKRYGMYFLWDSYGRDHETLTVKPNSNAVLVAVRSPENLYYYIVNLGNMNIDGIFSIRKLQMSKIIPNCSNLKMDQVSKNSIETFQIVSNKYAILKGHIHIGSICFKELRYKQSLTVAIIALLYSKISPTCSWDNLMIDEIIVFGTTFYKTWSNCLHCSEFTLYDIPNKITIGQYMIDVSVNLNIEFGQWKCVSNYKRSGLTKALKNCFAKNVNLILQIESKSYAIWKRHDIYYIFDPYEHQANRGDFERYKSAVLHMCSTINQCCSILTQLILEIPSATNFNLHSVRILNIVDRRIETNYEEGQIFCITRTSGILKNEEIKSLNESVEDLVCHETFKCTCDLKNLADKISVADLNSPGISETQIAKDYFDIQNQIMFETQVANAEKKLKEELRRKLNEDNIEESKIQDKEDLYEEQEKEAEDGITVAQLFEGENLPDEDTFTISSQKNDILPIINDDLDEQNKNHFADTAHVDDDNELVQKVGDLAKGDKDITPKGGEDEILLDKLAKSTEIDKMEMLAKICKSDESCAPSVRSCPKLEIKQDIEICNAKYLEPITCAPHAKPKRPTIHSFRKKLAIVGTEKCTYKNLRNLLNSAFKCTDRLLAITKYGNYIVFKYFQEYYLYKGCIHNVGKFRCLDLSISKSDFIYLATLDDVISFMKYDAASEDCDWEEINVQKKIEDICNEYGT
ncbi:uncharacterized protein LOC129611247 [Condylostylus longicornis]|uniref:uncharacterized protein LOC129611247 n=1 Tax=Condylostylus longicornis TaxID=2530218 RepID=UPI00244DE218|nr:uncharacterized protein LOC129611247 [Condylostylus longicornis]